MKSKKLIIIYLLLLVVVIFFMVVLYKNLKPASPRDLKEIQKEGILRIVTEYNQLDYFVSGDTIEGFQYELIQAISKLSGLEIQLFLNMSLSESFKGLNEQKYDIIARNIPITSEINEKYLFSDHIVFNKQVLVQRTAKANNSIQPIRNQLELAKKTLYIPKNSPALLRIANLRHEIGDTIFVIEEPRYSSEQLIIMVAKGDIDYAVCDQQTAKMSKAKYPEIDIDTDISFTQLQSWAVRRNAPVLLDSLNHWLKTVHESGLYEKIYKKYYNQK